MYSKKISDPINGQTAEKLHRTITKNNTNLSPKLIPITYTANPTPPPILFLKQPIGKRKTRSYVNGPKENKSYITQKS